MGKKNIITEEIATKVKELWDQKWGSRKIAKELGITRDFVQKTYKYLWIYDVGRTTPKTIDFDALTELTCKICNEIKPVSEFRERSRMHGNKLRKSYECYCKSCEKEYSKISCKERYKNNKQWHVDYKEKNFEKISAYMKEYGRHYGKNRRKEDVNYKLRTRVSSAVCNYIKNFGGSKNGHSCLEFLPFSIQELRDHLENLFEPWMTWNNYGVYRREYWDDNNMATWTWQIDHIIPHSTFKYISMEDDLFKKCWALENLRPYSSKLNFMDGVRRTRHKAA